MSDSLFHTLVISSSFLAGTVASVAGFGIGSLLTPLLALKIGMKTSVALVSIPHLIGTLIRFIRLRRFIDRKLFIQFGFSSALGGLIGALMHNSLQNHFLGFFLGVLLVLSAIFNLIPASKKLHLSKKSAPWAGAFSGMFGGLVGNQGGIRAAALLAFPLSKEQFIATATATALIVDFTRMPIYFFKDLALISDNFFLIFISSLGVLLGTLSGAPLLQRMSETTFRKCVGVLMFLLGLYLMQNNV